MMNVSAIKALSALSEIKAIFDGATSQTENFELRTLVEVENTDSREWNRAIPSLKMDENNTMQLICDSTSKPQLYAIAGYLMATVLGPFIGKILDPFVGNGIGLSYFLDGLGAKSIEGIETSDITDFPNRKTITGYSSSFEICNAASANVCDASILLVFDAPPFPGESLNYCNYADVKLVMRYTMDKLKKIKKCPDLKFYVLLLGEIGAGCNTAGIFNWLNGHPHLTRIYHRYIYKKSDSEFKGHRELLLFRVVIRKGKIEYPLDNIKRSDLTDDPPIMVEISHVENVAGFYNARLLNDSL
jgi:hypothetical protein